MPDTENRLAVAKRRGGGGMDWEFGISIDKLVYIGWMNNKVLLSSTGNSLQHSVLTHNAKEYKNVYMYN